MEVQGLPSAPIYGSVAQDGAEQSGGVSPLQIHQLCRDSSVGRAAPWRGAGALR